MLAAQAGCTGTVKLLIEREDVEADLKDNRGYTALMLAAESGYEGIVELLLEREDIDSAAKNNLGQTPLSLAALRGHIGIVELLRLKLERSGARGDGDDESRKGNESQV